jgi:DnaJ-class molecular chaperone
MADDPYTVLGVPRTASEDDIRRAYRKLAKELHPDLNPANRTQAEERFKKVSAAYGVIGDAEKRKQYDRGEIDANGEPRRGFRRPPGGGGFAGRGMGGQPPPEDFSFGDIFSDLFGSMRGRGEPGSPFGANGRGRDARYSLEVDFLEAAAGAKKRVTLPESGALDITVPQGVVDGQVLRLKGRGLPGVRRGGEPGDALIEIKVRPHHYFKRTDDDIAIDIPVTLDEAVLGAKIEVPTISGRVQLTLPKGTSSGRIFRLKGKGVQNVTTGHTGDQLVTVRIVLPDSIDDDLSYFLSEWRHKHKYDPGRP